MPMKLNKKTQDANMLQILKPQFELLRVLKRGYTHFVRTQYSMA